MMGDSRVQRWLSTICEVEYNDKQTWHYLIHFLERDLKAQQLETSQKTKERSKHLKKKGMLEDITAISLVTQV